MKNYPHEKELTQQNPSEHKQDPSCRLTKQY